MNKKTQAQPLSDNMRKLIIIIAIVLVAVIVLSIALALILKADTKNPANDNTNNGGSSSLTIKNGDFMYSTTESTSYPRTAQNWAKYTYKDGEDIEEITGNDKSVMGIIDVGEDKWNGVVADLNEEGIANLTNPGTHASLENEDDNNIYMIYNSQLTSASILSDSTSVVSGASIKITVWLNAQQIGDGNAVIMIQKSSVSAKEENWYAYDFKIVGNTGDDIDENGWQKHEFYIFNRESSTKYIRVSVGLGNMYTDEAATGALFVDDITYETVTANDYREQVDDTSYTEVKGEYKRYQIIENEDITDDSQYATLQKEVDGTASGTVDVYETSEDYVREAGYSPFTNRDDFMRDGKESGFVIYRVDQNGENQVVALRLETSIELASSPIEKDHYHISFWVRVQQKDGHAATKANVYVQSWNSEESSWKDITSGSFTSITTSQDISDDTNSGWVKYDIYLKPSTAVDETISIYFVLGNKDGYSDEDINNGLAPRGSLYVTSPAWEKISYKDYNNASSSSFVKKLDLVGNSASTSVTNGSFSTVNNLGTEPTSWTPVFAGDNAIYKDGKGNELSDDLRTNELVAGSGIVKGNSPVDDDQKNALQIKTNGTNFGYISNDISLSSRTVYVFSVLVKLEDADHPFIYLVDTSKGREDKGVIIARVEGTQDIEENLLDYAVGDTTENVDGWVRYYLVYVTTNTTATVRLALFNGKIDAVDGQDVATGTILYDSVKMKAIGTYALNTPEDEDATEYEVEFRANSGYDKAIDALTTEDHDAINTEGDLYKALGGAFEQPDEDTWTEIRQIPEDNGDDDTSGDDTTTAPTTSEVDWALLMSVISSIVLVAALLVVFVIKFFQRKGRRAV